MNSTLGERHRNQVAALRAKAEQHKGKAGVNAICATVAFLLWATIHAGFWFAAVSFTIVALCAYLTMMHVEEWNIARRQSEIDP